MQKGLPLGPAQSKVALGLGVLPNLPRKREKGAAQEPPILGEMGELGPRQDFVLHGLHWEGIVQGTPLRQHGTLLWETGS